MRRSHRTAVLLAAAVAAVTLSAHRVPAADDAAPAADAATPVVVGSLGVASITDLVKLIDDTAGQGTGAMAKSMLDRAKQAAPIDIQLGEDQRIGMAFYAGGGLTARQSVVAAIPLKEGSVTADQIKGLGAQPVDGAADLLTIPNADVYVKRTAGYVLMAPSDKAVKDVKEAAVVAGFTTPPGPFSMEKAGSLLVGTIDLAAIRKAAPAAYADAIEKVKRQAEATAAADGQGNADREAGRRVGQQMLLSAIEHLQQGAMSLSTDAEAVRLSFAVTPGQFDAPRPRGKPGFPDGCVGRVDFTYANAAQAAWMADSAGWLSTNLTDVTAKDEKAAAGMAGLRHAASELFNGKALSVALRPAAAGKFVAYGIEEFDGEPDMAAAVKHVADDVKGMAPNPAAAAGVTVEAYDEGAQHVIRLSINDPKDKDVACLDVAQSGHTVRMTIAADAEHHLADLMAAKPDVGQLTKPCEGSIDAGAMAQLAADAPGGALAGMDDATKGQIIAAFKGQQVTFDLVPAGPYAQMNLVAPRQMLQTLVQMGMTARPH